MCARGGGGGSSSSRSGAGCAGRSRVAGSVREVGSVPASGQARAPAAAAMSAIIEQEFQEIDAANDWQARYLVSEGDRSGSAPPGRGGRTGRGPAAGSARCRYAPPQRGAEVAGPRLCFRCTQENCGPALRMLAGGGRRGGLAGGAGSAQAPCGAPCPCACAPPAAGVLGAAAPARARRRPGPLSRVLAGGSGGLGAEGLTERLSPVKAGEGVFPAVSRQSGKLYLMPSVRPRLAIAPGLAALPLKPLRGGSSGSRPPSAPAWYRCLHQLGLGRRPARLSLRKCAACPFTLAPTRLLTSSNSLWVGSVKQTLWISLQY